MIRRSRRLLKPFVASVVAISLSTLLVEDVAARQQSPIKKHKKSLQEIETAIERKQQEISNLLDKESSIVSMLDQLDRRIDDKKTSKRKFLKEKTSSQTTIKQRNRQIAALEREVVMLRENVEERLRTIYKLGDLGYLRLIFGLQEIRDVTQTLFIMRRIINSDLENARLFDVKRQELAEEKDSLLEEQKRLAKLVERIDLENQQIRQQKRRQQSLLGLTRNQKDFHLKSVDELREAAANLQKLIDKLGRQSYRSDFALMKGMLTPPTTAAAVRGFGRYRDAKFNTSRRHNGVAFATKQGQEIISVYAGKVIFSGWFRGYGKIIIVDHGDSYYTMYAHLDEILKKQGSKVKEKEAIGKAGNTGSLKGNLLYFELRHRGQAVNPMPWFHPLKVNKK